MRKESVRIKAKMNGRIVRSNAATSSFRGTCLEPRITLFRCGKATSALSVSKPICGRRSGEGCFGSFLTFSNTSGDLT